MRVFPKSNEILAGPMDYLATDRTDEAKLAGGSLVSAVHCANIPP